MAKSDFGKTLRLRIESVAYRGIGVARADGMVVFVPETCQGELVVAKITRAKKSFSEARVVEILESSPARLSVPDCRSFGPEGEIHVPGCVYDHMSHAAELECKQEQLLSFLKRQAGQNEDFAVLPPFSSPAHLHYRNKAVLHVGRDASGRRAFGYFGDDNRSIVDIPSCPLSALPICDAIESTRSDSAFRKWSKDGDAVSFRWTETDGTCVWVRRASGKEEPPSSPRLHEQVPGLGEMQVPARGFWQMNNPVAREMFHYVAELLRSQDCNRFMDFYCGVGVFALLAANAGIEKVAGVESGRDAVAAAKSNALRLGFAKRATFSSADAAIAAPTLLSEMGGAGATALVDPPRAGLAPEMVAALLSTPVPNLFYVSCAPDTLARDLRLLCSDGGYKLRSVRLFDMFPRTAHFETVCLLEHSRFIRQ